MLLVLVVPIMLFQRLRAARARGGQVRSQRLVRARARWCSGFVFLYVPIISVIVFSFNDSRLVTVWGGASPTLKWYAALLHNQQILGAAWLSLRIALVSATAAVMLGTLAGLALARFGRFRGRTLLAGMVTAPLVMPEVITGLSLLLLFVAMAQLIGWPRGRRRASRSRSRTSPSAWPTSRWWCSRAWPASTNRSRKRPWIWARAR